MSIPIRRAGLGVAVAAVLSLAIAPAAHAQPLGHSGDHSYGNHAPVSFNRYVDVDENVKADVTLAARDADGDALNYIVKTFPTHGTIGGAGRNLDYTPATDYTGPDSFTYWTSDGHDYSNVATVYLTVKHGDAKPVANNQAVVTNQDTPVTITLTGSDPDKQNLTFAKVDGPAHGTLSDPTGNGAVRTYTPAAGYSGPDKFTFTASDGKLTSALATVEITVVKAVPVNQPPTATSKSVETLKNTPVHVKLEGKDPEGGALNTIRGAGPSHGTLVLTGDDALYTPATDFVGTDSFTFTVNDGHASSAPGTITITVKAPVVPVNLPPSADSKSLTTVVNRPVSTTLTGSDPEKQPLTFKAGQPSHGTVTQNGATVVYTPNRWFTGIDSFTYTANDGVNTSAPATVTVVVQRIKHRPVAYDQSVATGKNDPVRIHLNGWSDDHRSLDFIVTDRPDHGRLVQRGDDVVYLPYRGFSGYDAFHFVVRDSDGDVSKPATVTIKVKRWWDGH